MNELEEQYTRMDEIFFRPSLFALKPVDFSWPTGWHTGCR
jgi:hypothetical protein